MNDTSRTDSTHDAAPTDGPDPPFERVKIRLAETWSGEVGAITEAEIREAARAAVGRDESLDMGPRRRDLPVLQRAGD